MRVVIVTAAVGLVAVVEEAVAQGAANVLRKLVRQRDGNGMFLSIGA